MSSGFDKFNVWRVCILISMSTPCPLFHHVLIHYTAQRYKPLAFQSTAETYTCQLFLSQKREIFILWSAKISKDYPMTQSIPTASIPPPPPPAFVGHLSFLKKYVANAPWWGHHIYTNPHGGALGRGQIPDPSKKYSHQYSMVFLMVFQALLCF